MTHAIDKKALEWADVEYLLKKQHGYKSPVCMKAAITAYLAKIGKTHVLVPREPTPEIAQAGEQADMNEHGPLISKRQAAMLYLAMIETVS